MDKIRISYFSVRIFGEYGVCCVAVLFLLPSHYIHCHQITIHQWRAVACDHFGFAYQRIRFNGHGKPHKKQQSTRHDRTTDKKNVTIDWISHFKYWRMNNQVGRKYATNIHIGGCVALYLLIDGCQVTLIECSSLDCWFNTASLIRTLECLPSLVRICIIFPIFSCEFAHGRAH